MDKDKPARPNKKNPSFLRQLFRYTILLLVGFLLGFIPMWLLSRNCTSNLLKAQNQLSLARIQNALASAVMDVRRGNYESARVEASSFFTSLRAEADKGNDSALSPAQKEAVPALIVRRDEIVTLLARDDSSAADLLADLHASYREIVE